jgi:hypothetical protein
MGHEIPNSNQFGPAIAYFPVMDEWTDQKGRLFYSGAKAARRCPPSGNGWRQRAVKAQRTGNPGPFEPVTIRGDWFFLAAAVEAERARHLGLIGAVEPPDEEIDPNAGSAGAEPITSSGKGKALDSAQTRVPSGMGAPTEEFVAYLKAELADRDIRVDSLQSQLEQAKIVQQRSDDKYGEQAAKLAKLRADYALVAEVARRAGLDDEADMDQISGSASIEPI